MGKEQNFGCFWEKEEAFAQLTAFYALSLPEYHMPVHAHDSYEIMYVTGGTCQVILEEAAFSLSSSQFIFLRNQVPHRLEVSSGSPCTILNLEFSLHRTPSPFPLSELYENSPEFSAFFTGKEGWACGSDLRSLGYAMKDLISQLQKKQAGGEYLLRILFYRTMLELSYCAGHSREVSKVRYLKKACAYIEQNLLEALTVPEIAAHAGINKSYLQLLFSESLGCSVGSYVTGKRMEQAAFLLINSSLSITDIAFASGYNSRQHFAHTFEKQFQMSPLAYRKLHARTLVPDTEDSRFLLDESGGSLRQKMTQ